MMKSGLLALSVAPCMVVAAHKCPSSSSLVHAQASVDFTTTTSCASLADEIRARIAGNQDGSWVDPHNGGQYSLLDSSDSIVKVQRNTGSASISQGGPFTDLINFNLADSNGGCAVSACSVSQVTSVTDFSGNYCNQRNLYCGSDVGCKTVLNDFTFSEGDIELSKGLPFVPGASADASMCIVPLVSAVAPNVEPLVPKCPSSPWLTHAQASVDFTAATSCASLADEILARIAGNQDGSWVDPHNGGQYSLLGSSDSILKVARKTGSASIPQGGPFTDLINFNLAYSYGGCAVTACSVSQVQSVTDFSGNYCNQRNLYCGSNVGCKTVLNDFTFSEGDIELSKGLGDIPGASADASMCIVPLVNVV